MHTPPRASPPTVPDLDAIRRANRERDIAAAQQLIAIALVAPTDLTGAFHAVAIPPVAVVGRHRVQATAPGAQPIELLSSGQSSDDETDNTLII